MGRPGAWTAAWCRLAFKVRQTQFHLEKSQKASLQPRNGFVELAKLDCEKNLKIAEADCRLVVFFQYRDFFVHGYARTNHP